MDTTIHYRQWQDAISENPADIEESRRILHLAQSGTLLVESNDGQTRSIWRPVQFFDSWTLEIEE